MRLLLIRHAEPDYSIDSLTEKGHREAELLSLRMVKTPFEACYVSPLGRAKATAAYTLEKTGCSAQECEWLKEFPTRIRKPYMPQKDSIVWDWLPSEWTQHEAFFGEKSWYEEKGFEEVKAEYLRVTEAFDTVLAQHGYVRKGKLYRVQKANRDTLVFFCHFGIICVLMSHLMNLSPMVLWHQIVLQPSSVTGFYTEERRRGIASFRADLIGDISHLYAGGEEPSFAARFCEIFDSDERHD